MKIIYIGAGFVGTCSAAVAANSGHDALVYDIDQRKIDMLGSGNRDTIESCLFEEGLGDLLIRNKERVEFTTDYKKIEVALDDADAVFMCLPTPEIGETGESDLRFYNAAADTLAKALNKRNSGKQDKYIVIVNKSTVPIDMIDRTAEILEEYNVKNVGVVSNPEFLVEGKAIQGSLRPDRIVVGAWTKTDFDVMRGVYQRFIEAPGVQYIEVNPKEAAASKLLANFYLFNKLMLCFDVAGRVCETFSDLKFENIRRVLTTDKRIGDWGFYDSLYAGGSCFIKDARSLSHQLTSAGQNAVLVDESNVANRRQLQMFIGRAANEAAFNWEGKTVALLGLAFKRDTNDIRNAPSLDIIPALREKQVKLIKAYDPAAMGYCQTAFPAASDLQYTAASSEAIDDADVVIIATDWPQFRGLGDELADHAKKILIMDGRRMLQHNYSMLVEAGHTVIAVGSPLLKKNK